MKILHTADWHLGAHLFRFKRDAEHRQFLDDLLQIIERENVEALLIAGDIFDTQNPSHSAQQLYFDFLARLVKTHCRHTIISSGNHDSSAFLKSPQKLLKALNIHIVCETSDENLIPLTNHNGEIEAWVAAAPYLRERDLYNINVINSLDDDEAALINAISDYYENLAKKADSMNKNNVPVIAMGHLFSAGAKISDDEAIRDLYVGKLGLFPASRFPESFAYVALGHIHRPQKLTANIPVFYSGSPIPLSFGEAEFTKSVQIFNSQTNQVDITPLPTYQVLRCIKGSESEINQKLKNLANENILLEVIYTGEEYIHNLHQKLLDILENKPAKLLRLVAPNINQTSLSLNSVPDLNSLTPEELFLKRLELQPFDNKTKKALQMCFSEIMQNLN